MADRWSGGAWTSGASDLAGGIGSAGLGNAGFSLAGCCGPVQNPPGLPLAYTDTREKWGTETGPPRPPGMVQQGVALSVGAETGSYTRV